MKVRNVALCGLFAALLALCAWISIPVTGVAFTMQTFAVFLTLLLLGGKRGTASIGVYLLLGMIGLPVFSGFQGGIGVLLGVTGGYLAGFLATGLVYWCLTALFPGSAGGRILALIAGLVCCYLLGSVWFYGVYLQGGTSLGFGMILAKCVLPYLLPDGLKLCLALLLARKLNRFVY